MLLVANFKKELIMFKRYLFNSLGGVITLYILFLCMFYGYNAATSLPTDSTNTDFMVVYYAFWMLALFVYQDMVYSIQEESKLGTLEQIYMSKFSLARIIVSQNIAKLLVNITLLFVVIFAIMATTGKWLHFDLFSVSVIVLLAVVNLFGIGFIFGGLALIFKKIENFLQIVPYCILGVFLVPVGSNPFLKLIPTAWEVRILGNIMVGGISIFDLSAMDWFFLVVPSIVYFVIGLAIFNKCEKVAVDRAVLGKH
ncbi:MAG: transporter [Clostridiales bacterium]|nr:transporter [Clostridiales bacterium]